MLEQARLVIAPEELRVKIFGDEDADLVEEVVLARK